MSIQNLMYSRLKFVCPLKNKDFVALRYFGRSNFKYIVILFYPGKGTDVFADDSIIAPPVFK